MENHRDEDRELIKDILNAPDESVVDLLIGKSISDKLRGSVASLEDIAPDSYHGTMLSVQDRGVTVYLLEACFRPRKKARFLISAHIFLPSDPMGRPNICWIEGSTIDELLDGIRRIFVDFDNC